MKKRRNIAAAIVLSSMMAVSTCAFTVTSMTASAYTVTINNKSDDSAAHSYEAYQVFSGTLSESGDNAVLSNIMWGSGVNGSALLTALQNNSNWGGSSPFASATTPAQVADIIDNWDSSTNAANLQKFSELVNSNVNAANKLTSTSNVITATNAGYYFIKDVSASLSNSAYSKYILKVVDSVTVTAKTDVPTSGKKVDDKNDSTGTSELLQDSADYDIGDNVPYTLTFTLPSDYAQYEQYPITFIDDMCAGLTYNGDAKIWYGEVSGAGTDITFTKDGGAASTTNGNVYKATITDLKSLSAASSLTAGSTITIKYTAKLNSNAVVGSAGNENTYKVQYANNPNWKPTPDDTTPPTSETPPSTNKVYTYKLVINKVEPDGNSTKPLTGADFTLYKFIADSSGTSTTLDSSTSLTGNWVDVTSLNTGAGAVNPTKDISAKDAVADSVFTFSGLDDGWYKLVETTTPAGYNSIDDKIFQITPTANGDLEDISSPIALTADDTAGSLTGNVVNNQGATLPSTGGIGTTLFYIIGGTLVAGSIVLLITKKRMHSTEE